MKKILFVVVCALSVFEISAQQDPQFTQNMFNRLSVNPGYAGTKGALCGTLLSREQWLGFEGNPKTNLFSVDYGFKVRQQYPVGVGLTFIQDEIGPIRSLNAKAAFSYQYRIQQGVLSGGLELGIFNQSINGDWRTSEGNFDGTEDPRIPNSEAGSTTLDVGFGLYYYTKKLYVGLSSTHLNQPEISDKPDETSSLTFQQVRHYYIMGGYNYETALMGKPFEIQPSVFVKTDAVSTQVDFNTNVEYNNLIWTGVSYRVQDAVAFLAGIDFSDVLPQLDGLRVGFAYDYNISDLSDYNNGSIEFMVNYCYKFSKTPQLERYKSVRFL